MRHKIFSVVSISMLLCCMVSCERELCISDYKIVIGETAVDTAPAKQLRVDCPTGTKAIGAGWSVLDPTGAILEGQATYFEPAYDGSHWITNAKNLSTFEQQWQLRVRLICADVCEKITE